MNQNHRNVTVISDVFITVLKDKFSASTRTIQYTVCDCLILGQVSDRKTRSIIDRG